MPVPAIAARMCETFLSETDARSPGLVDGLYLVGSIALDDFHERGSDVDFVAVLAHRADEAELSALAAAHAAVRERHPGAPFEGTHLTRDDIAAGPDCPAAPGALGKRFQAETRFSLNPVTWYELATIGIPIRPAADLEVPTSDAALRTYSRDNLTAYWQDWSRQARRLRPRALIGSQTCWATAWAVLGVGRLHHAIATGGHTSKCGAGRYARDAFDACWHPIVDEALHIREYGDGTYRSRLRRRRDMLGFLDIAIDSALALPA